MLLDNLVSSLSVIVGVSKCSEFDAKSVVSSLKGLVGIFPSHTQTHTKPLSLSSLCDNCQTFPLGSALPNDDSGP